MPTSNATAVWEGKLRDGKGSFKGESGAFSGAYSFRTRFEGVKGTNPEELIAAAHAACFSMALSAGLEKAGTPATRIETRSSRALADTSRKAFRMIRPSRSFTSRSSQRKCWRFWTHSK